MNMSGQLDFLGVFPSFNLKASLFIMLILIVGNIINIWDDGTASPFFFLSNFVLSTAAERAQVDQFFKDSALSERPVVRFIFPWKFPAV